MTREQLQQIREVLVFKAIPLSGDAFAKAIAILDAELAKPEPEPVGCKHNRYSVDVHEQTGTCYDCGAEGRMRFVVDGTAPPSREWQGLTDEERQECQKQALEGFRHAIKTGGVNPPTIDVIVEAALRAKNTGEQA